MVILMNFGPRVLNVEYKKGNKAYFKQLPEFSAVAMKDLNSISQISNRNFLSRTDTTIWEYETDTYLNRSANTPTGSTTLPLIFIGNNKKRSQNESIAYGFSGATTVTGMTFTANNIARSTVFSFITSATSMTNNTQSVSASSPNIVVYFSGAGTTTQDIYAALTGSSFSGLGITMTGPGATKITTGGTAQFFLTASTTDVNSGYVFLSRLV